MTLVSLAAAVFAIAPIAAGARDRTAPTAPTNITVASATTTSVAVAWTASTDNVGVAGYRVYRNGSSVGRTVVPAFNLTSLKCGTTYTVGVAAYDAAGNTSKRTSAFVASLACPDTRAPTAPSGLAVASRTESSITLSWSGSSDNVGVVGYELLRNGAPAGQTAQTSYPFGGVLCGTAYTLGVRAFDAAGNRSGWATATAATSPCPDTQPPSAPAGLVQTSTNETSAGLSWVASSDNTGVVGYGVYIGSVRVGSATGTSFVFTGLSCGSTYGVAVDAVDAASNTSARAPFLVTTAACPAPVGGGAYQFDGSDDRLEFARGIRQLSVPTYTILAWVLRDGTGEVRGRIAQRGPADTPSGVRHMQITVGDIQTAPPPPDSSISFRQAAATPGVAIGPHAALPQGEWVQIGVSYNRDGSGNRARLWKNGSALATSYFQQSAGEPLYHESDAFTIGDTAAGQRAFGGRIAYFAIWNVELTGADVAAFYAGGLPRQDALIDFLRLDRPGATSGDKGVLATPSLIGSSGSQSSGPRFITGGPPVTYQPLGSTPPADTQPPTAPSAAAASDITQTSFSLRWGASSDNLGVTGYEVLLNGSQVAATSGTSFTFSGLGCEKSYTAGVRARDAAGNQSTVSTLPVTTSPCAPEPTDPAEPAPSLFVSLSGSDANACTQAAPCKTLNRAYNLAQPGQVVELAAGRYPGEMLTDQSGTRRAPNVVVRPAAGASVSFTSRLMLYGARYLTLRDILVEPFADYWSLQLACASNVTLANVGGGRRFHISKSDNVLMRGGWWGNYGTSGEADSHIGHGGPNCIPAQAGGPSRNVTLDGVTIRDVFWGVGWDTNQSHPDCLQIDEVDNLTIRNSRFLRCGQVFIGYYGDGNLHGALIENNVFAKIGSDVYYSTQINDVNGHGTCKDIVFRNNTYDNSGGNTIADYGFPRIGCTGGNVRVLNNIFHTSPRPDACGIHGTTWTHNVYERASSSGGRRFLCGRRALLALRGDAGFIDRRRNDYRLRSDSQALDRGSPADYPRFDLRGERRYVGRAPDAGAYERIRRRR